MGRIRCFIALSVALALPASASAAVSPVPVPAAARAVAATHPAHIVGTGTPSSCTSAEVVRDVALGGIITFNCGAAPVTIVMRSTARVSNASHLTVLDGGGKVTLSGGGVRRILLSDTCMKPWTTSDCWNQPYPQVVVQDITFADGDSGTPQSACSGASAPPGCAYGGGAIFAEGGRFKAVASHFIDNRCTAEGPDLGGAAIRAVAEYDDRPLYVTDDTFTGGRCSNGGALSSIDVQWTVLNSTFIDNRAIGWGANPAARGTPGGGSGGAIYTDGDDYDVHVGGSLLQDNTAREGGGAIFDVVDNGWGTLSLTDSTLSHNPSGEFQNAPGIFCLVDGRERAPVRSGTTL